MFTPKQIIFSSENIKSHQRRKRVIDISYLLCRHIYIYIYIHIHIHICSYGTVKMTTTKKIQVLFMFANTYRVLLQDGNAWLIIAISCFDTSLGGSWPLRLRKLSSIETTIDPACCSQSLWHTLISGSLKTSFL